MWTNSRPTVEGWYFWKRNRNWTPWLWQAIYVTMDKGKRVFWESGTAVNAPRGGWWKSITQEIS